MSAGVTIRRIEAHDEARWRALREGYCGFYERAPDEPVAWHTWKRIMDPASPVFAIVPERRAAGVGKLLIDWLVREMKAQRWSRLYWNTRANNYRARGLYDKYTLESGFVRYVIANPAAT